MLYRIRCFQHGLYTCFHGSITKNLYTVHRTLTELDGRVFTITCSHLRWLQMYRVGWHQGGFLPLRGLYYTTYNGNINSILKVKVSAPSQRSYGKTVNRLRNLLVAISLRFPSQPTPPLNPTPPTPAPRKKRPHAHVNSQGIGIWRYHCRLLQYSQTCLCYSQVTTWPPNPQENISLVF